jgi:tetratricopeptide (TPR) repeat protein
VKSAPARRWRTASSARRPIALDALPRIVELLEGAASRAPSLDDAGPDRVLALVLVRAPGWPTGPGDPDLALEHARRAVELAPRHAPNRLCLAEALEAVDLDDEARAELRAATELVRAGEAAGDPRAGDWRQESDRLQARFDQ